MNSKCNKCNQYGHSPHNCLRFPNEIHCNSNNNSNVSLQCSFCGSDTHFICPFPNEAFVIKEYDSDEIELSLSEDDNNNNIKIESKTTSNNNNSSNHNEKIPITIPKKIVIPPVEASGYNFNTILDFFKKEFIKTTIQIKQTLPQQVQPTKPHIKLKPSKIFQSINNEDIQSTIFCYKCGGTHNAHQCDMYNNNKKNVKSKLIQSPYKHTHFIYSNHHTSINYHVKNPLKFQAMQPKNEFKINHHMPYDNCYNDNNSSGESFGDFVEEYKKKYNKN